MSNDIDAWVASAASESRPPRCGCYVRLDPPYVLGVGPASAAMLPAGEVAGAVSEGRVSWRMR